MSNFSSESTLAAATADVVVYDDAAKRWIAPDDGVEPARSHVRMLRNTHTYAYRIVGNRLQDRQCILTFNVHEKLKYHSETPSFHHWRDEKKRAYGLRFLCEKEAGLFIKAITQALAILTPGSDQENGPAIENSNGINHEPQQLHHVVHNEPLLRGNNPYALVPDSVVHHYLEHYYSLRS